MMIHFIAQQATPKQIEEMLETFGDTIKLAVDVKKGVLSGGGEFHADCGAVLLQEGSEQEDIWGADWFPKTREIRFVALVNVRPRQKNRSLEIQEADLRHQVETVIRGILEKK